VRPGVSRLADIKPSKTDCNLLIDLEQDNEATSFFGESGSADTHLQFANCDALSDLFSNFNTLRLAQTDS